MLLSFKPRDPKYVGEGDLPFGTFDDTNDWLPPVSYLAMGAGMFPDKTMFRVADRNGVVTESFTYEQTNSAANRVANGLREGFGVARGDMVGIYMLNSPEFVLSILGIHKAAAVQVPINKDEKGDRLAYIINHSDMHAIIIDEGSIPMIEGIAGELAGLKTIFVTAAEVPGTIGGIRALPFSTFEQYSPEPPPVALTVADMERCMMTSGTTGYPKGVVRNHGGVLLTVRGYLQQLGVRSDDVLMSVLTLGHANSQVMCLFASICAGATAVFFPRFSASGFWKWAADCDATIANMLGGIADYLWAAPESEWDRKHRIRVVLAAPAPRNITEYHERFATRVIDGYGSTEMGVVMCKDPEDNRPGSSGHQMEGYHLEVRNSEDTSEVLRPTWDPSKDPTPPDEAKGLLFIKPLIPHTTLNEYLKDQLRTGEAFDDDGFFNSDDVFAQGIDGRFYFQGRYTRIRVSGENVDPVSVADTARRHEAVEEAVAVGIRLPDVSDDEIKLNVTLAQGAVFDPVAFSKWMATVVPVFMVPRFIEVYEGGFPLTATQKVKMAELKGLGDATWDRVEAGLKFSTRK